MSLFEKPVRRDGLVVVTGGASGIGRASAQAFAARGRPAHVFYVLAHVCPPATRAFARLGDPSSLGGLERLRRA